MTTKRMFLAGVFAIATSALVALPSFAQQATQALAGESVIEGIKERGVIKIGLSLFVPWSMRAKNGDLIGFELDVGRKLAEDMGVEVEFVETAWDGIIPALVSGKFDVIISGMSWTPQRNLTVNFSEPYAYSGLKILANKKLTEGLTIKDLNDPKVIFSARRGATPATVIAAMFPDATLLQFDEDGAAAQEVLNGNAWATMSSEPTPSREARNHPDDLYVMEGPMFDQRGEGFVYRKGDPDATNYFNNWIGQNWRSGWLQARHDYWFTTEDWADQVE